MCDVGNVDVGRSSETAMSNSDLSESKLKTESETKVEKDFSGTKSGFKNALSVYINKPHVVNRRLCGAKILYQRWYPVCEENEVSSLSEHFTKADDMRDEGEETHVITQADEDVDLDSYEEGVVIIVRDLIPRQIDKYPTLRELVHYDCSTDSISFIPVCHVQSPPPHKQDLNEDAYKFTYKTDDTTRVQLSVRSNKDAGHVTWRWLSDVLLQKIVRWGQEETLRTATSSLRLVPVDEYNRLYNDLKVKYGHPFVEKWPEKTDPKKFVYEDVAIATYLLLIWKEDRERRGVTQRQSFVDLGCGNGLLVHILAAEGHHGLGLDIRRRGIWDMYGSETMLKEQTVIPSADSLFPTYDWLIGNHSDELTPWIPLMAARSSYNCCYFVLPCCLHDFDKKFSEREKGTSPYRTYLNFVKEVGEVCGFQVEEDTLRIPSTKRVCFIGRGRTYAEKEDSLQDTTRTLYVQKRCVQDNPEPNSPGCKRPRLDVSESGKGWSANFEPRQSEEPVRNCQKVATATKQAIVKTVFEKILVAPDGEVVSLDEGKLWRKGGSLPLCEVAQLFDKDILQQLKAESGGLQTLLRNHNSVFQVSGGRVRLRDFSQANPWSQSRKAKTKKLAAADHHKTSLCWFHDKHPDGCPRSADKCDFAHGQQELRGKTPLEK
ncbi:probable tRNA (uracil-O(2)-)-methyltransferase [Haliotis cracherodii]|uniref:probable tRNA (uracil-O(2)-)-methyltransferase n=1 Tax=Haliotis cracherodii TaxID=6455 RepID=UPI0039E90F88